MAGSVGWRLVAKKRVRSWPIKLRDGTTHVFSGATVLWTDEDLSAWGTLLERVAGERNPNASSAPAPVVTNRHDSGGSVPHRPVPQRPPVQQRTAMVMDRQTSAPVSANRAALPPVARIEYDDPKDEIPVLREKVDVDSFRDNNAELDAALREVAEPSASGAVSSPVGLAAKRVEDSEASEAVTSGADASDVPASSGNAAKAALRRAARKASE